MLSLAGRGFRQTRVDMSTLPFGMAFASAICSNGNDQRSLCILIKGSKGMQEYHEMNLVLDQLELDPDNNLIFRHGGQGWFEAEGPHCAHVVPYGTVAVTETDLAHGRRIRHSLSFHHPATVKAHEWLSATGCVWPINDPYFNLAPCWAKRDG